MRDYAADQQERWSGERFLLGQGGDGGAVFGLIFVGGAGDDYAGRFGGEAGVDEVLGDVGVIGARHIDGDGSVWREADEREELGFGTARERGEENVRGDAAIGERNFCGGRRGEGGGDAGDDFEGDVGGAEGVEFFGGAAEERGVAAFEADDDFVFGFLRGGD